MDRNKLNSIRRMAGVPVDYSAERLTEEESLSRARDDILAVINRVAKKTGDNAAKTLIKELKEGAYGHMSSANPDNVALPSLTNRSALDARYNQYTYKPAQEEEEREWDSGYNYEGPQRDDYAGDIEGRADPDGGYDDEDDAAAHHQAELDARQQSEEDDDERTEPELDRQTDYNAPPRDDGDDSYDEYEEDNDDFEPATNMCPACEGTGKEFGKGGGGDCEQCDGVGEVFEAKKPQAPKSVIASLTKSINAMDKEAAKWAKGKDEDDQEMADSVKRDMLDFKRLLRIVKQNQPAAARKFYRDLDTAARDYLVADKAHKQEVADYFDFTWLHESKAKKDYDGDGKVESSEDEHKGVVDKAIKKSKGKKTMKEGKKAKKDYDGDGEVESSEDEHKGVVDKAIKKSKKKKVKEAAHYHTDDNYPISHVDDDVDPINTTSSYDTVFDHNAKLNDEHKKARDDELTNDQTPVKVPPKFLTALKDRIKELVDQSEKAKPRDFERSNYYADTAEAFQIVYDLLARKDVEGLKRAQYYSQRMMNVQRAEMPDEVWKFIVDGGQKRSLKSYMNDVSKDFPVSGKPMDSVDIETLNKNTNTEI